MGEEESNEDLFPVAEEWSDIQERLGRVPYQMKLEIKEGLRLLAFPETTMLSPHPRKVPTKGANKKKSNLHQKRHVGSHLCGRLLILNIRKVNLHQKKSSQPKRKGARIAISPRSSIPKPPKPILVSRNYDLSSPMYYMPKFMRPYIERIVDVIGDGHRGFRAIVESLGLTEESHVIVRRTLIKEVKEHRNDYIKIYAGECRYNYYILDGLHPPKNGSGFAPPDKWLTLPDMRHIVASCYNRPVVGMTTLDIGVSETFFPLRGRPLVNPKSNMICLGLIPNHFVLLLLKDDCPLSPSSTELNNHRSGEAATWKDEFLDQHDRFRILMEIEKQERPVSPKKPTNQDNHILLNDTPIKTNEEFEDVVDHLDDLILLDEI